MFPSLLILSSSDMGLRSPKNAITLQQILFPMNVVSQPCVFPLDVIIELRYIFLNIVKKSQIPVLTSLAEMTEK